MKTKKKNQRSAQDIDVHVGQKLRELRTLKDISQEKLAEAVGLTFQQVQKYERGTNRISCSRLSQFADVLDVSVTAFFPDKYSDPGNQKLMAHVRFLENRIIHLETAQFTIRHLAQKIEQEAKP